MDIFDQTTKKNQICIVAVRLFSQKGYHATGMRELANMCGMTVGNLYNFFPSKEMLLFYILEQILKTIIINIRNSIDLNDDPIRQLEQAILFHIRFHGTHKTEALVSDTELRNLSGDMLEKILQYRDEYESMFIAIIIKGIETGVFSDVDTKLAGMAIITMCSQVSMWYKEEGRRNLDDIAADYTSLIVNGLKA